MPGVATYTILPDNFVVYRSVLGPSLALQIVYYSRYQNHVSTVKTCLPHPLTERVLQRHPNCMAASASMGRASH